MTKSFEDLDVFRRAVDLLEVIYKATRTFPSDERFGLSQQLRRAVVSVVSNIAEGQGRLTLGEWRQFLGQARGSLFEIQAQLIAAKRLTYMTAVEYARARSAIRRVAEPLDGLIAYVTQRAQSHIPTRPKAADNRQRAAARPRSEAAKPRS